MALQRQTLSIPISEGIDTKTDEKQVPAGKALALENVRFQKTGKLSKRFGLVSLPTVSYDGNFLASNKIGIVSDSDAINAITDNGIYNLPSVLGKWANISSFEDFSKISSDFIYKSSLNHFSPDVDFSSDFNLTAYAFREFQEGYSPTYRLEFLTVILEDSLTGLKKIKKYKIDPATDYTTLRYAKSQQKIQIVNDGGVAKIFVFYEINNFNGATGVSIVYLDVLDENLAVLSSTAVPYTFTSGTLQAAKMDVCKDSLNVFFCVMTGANLKLVKYSLSGAVVAQNTYVTTFLLGLSSASMPKGFSICLSPSNLHVAWIGRETATFSDFVRCVGFDKSLTNTIPESNISSSVSSIWSELSITFNTRIIFAISTTNTVATKNTSFFKQENTFSGAGYSTFSISPTINRVFHISRPFQINGNNYVLAKSIETDQRTGLVINTDQAKHIACFSPFDLSVDREVSTNPVGFTCNAVASNGIVYSAIEKIYGPYTSSISSSDFIANVGISKINLNFINDYSSGTKAKVGKTNYYTNGTTISLDSRSASESGFSLSPLIQSATQVVSGAANANVASKTFNYIAVYNFYNGKAELERSVPSPSVAITTTATATYISVLVKTLQGSYKDQYDASLNERFVTEIILYRASSVTGGVYYRCGNIPNTYTGDVIAINDQSADSDLLNNERLYTTGGVLESDVTPNARFSTAGGNRLFLGGLEEQDEVAYSNKQLFGEAVSFNGFNRVRVSSGASADKTPISALGYMDAKLIIFRKQSIYFIQGDGPNDLGIGSFSEPEIISSDVGCIEPRSVINTPMGLMFKSRKGIYLLSRSLSVEYIGAAVEDFNSFNVVSSVLSDKYNEARFYLSSGDCIVYNFLFQSWSIFKGQTIVDADVWQNAPVSIVSGKIFKETENTYLDNGASGFYSMKYVSPWLKLDLIQGYVRCYQLWIIGSYKSPHTLKCRVYVDYDSSTYDDYSLVYNNTDSPQYQFQISLPKQKVESIKFEIYDTAHEAASSGEAFDLSNIQVEVGMKAGGYKLANTKTY